jgi:ATP-dependent RNA helicase RhlE
LIRKNGHETEVIHGNKSQSARVNALTNFKSGKTKIMIATDIAARGIDISELSHVINYEIPNPSETYVHRIGRTARAGLSGIAISFSDIDEKSQVMEIQKLIKQTIPIVEHEFPMQIKTLSPKKEERKPTFKSNRSTSNKNSFRSKNNESNSNSFKPKNNESNSFKPKKVGPSGNAFSSKKRFNRNRNFK